MTTYALTAATGHFGQTAVKQLVALVGAENVCLLYTSDAADEL